LLPAGPVPPIAPAPRSPGRTPGPVGLRGPVPRGSCRLGAGSRTTSTGPVLPLPPHLERPAAASPTSDRVHAHVKPVHCSPSGVWRQIRKLETGTLAAVLRPARGTACASAADRLGCCPVGLSEPSALPLIGCRASGSSSARGCEPRSRSPRPLWSSGAVAILRINFAVMHSGQRAPGRSMGSRCWASRSSLSSASHSMTCLAAGSPHSAPSTCPPSGGWMPTGSSCCRLRTHLTSPCACARPTIRSSSNCWKPWVPRSPIPRTLAARPRGEDRHVPGGHHR
jgi:hypothetical protein